MKKKNPLAQVIEEDYKKAGATWVRVEVNEDEGYADVWFISPEPIKHIELSFLAQRSNISFEEIIGECK